MEHQITEEAESVPEDLNKTINDAIDLKLTAFKASLDLELMPIKIAVEAVAKVEVRLNAIEAKQAAESARSEEWREEQRRNHDTNTKKDDLILEKLSRHLGEHDGEDHSEVRHDRKVQRFREWLKVGGGFVSLGAIVGWAVTWGKHLWAKIHPPH